MFAQKGESGSDVDYLFNDEFTNLLDTAIGKDALDLLKRLNYFVEIIVKESEKANLLNRKFNFVNYRK